MRRVSRLPPRVSIHVRVSICRPLSPMADVSPNSPLVSFVFLPQTLAVARQTCPASCFGCRLVSSARGRCESFQARHKGPERWQQQGQEVLQGMQTSLQRRAHVKLSSSTSVWPPFLFCVGGGWFWASLFRSPRFFAFTCSRFPELDLSSSNGFPYPRGGACVESAWLRFVHAALSNSYPLPVVEMILLDDWPMGNSHCL